MTDENKNTAIQSLLGCSKSSSRREFYNNTNLPQELRKLWNKQPNHPPKANKEEHAKLKVSKRKEIIKIRAEINEIDDKNNRKY